MGKIDKTKAQVVRLRYFAGLTVRQAAEAMGISASTADNYWAYARAWLRVELRPDEATATNDWCFGRESARGLGDSRAEYALVDTPN
jgi:DNA-binding transcriptional regulator LsrR (DeoR family)